MNHETIVYNYPPRERAYYILKGSKFIKLKTIGFIVVLWIMFYIATAIANMYL